MLSCSFPGWAVVSAAVNMAVGILLTSVSRSFSATPIRLYCALAKSGVSGQLATQGRAAQWVTSGCRNTLRKNYTDSFTSNATPQLSRNNPSPLSLKSSPLFLRYIRQTCRINQAQYRLKNSDAKQNSKKKPGGRPVPKASEVKRIFLLAKPEKWKLAGEYHRHNHCILGENLLH